MPTEATAMAGCTMLLEQEYRYVYERPIRNLRHQIRAVPREKHGPQTRTTWDLTVSGATVDSCEVRDAFGNHVVEVEAPEVAKELAFTIRSTVSWNPCEADEPRGFDQVGMNDFTAPTPLTEANEELLAAATELGKYSTSAADFAERACEWSTNSLIYEHGVTGIRTAATAALSGGRGVCQDYAHVMLALCRAAKVPARYISGHLLGEGGSHAWVEVLTDTAWLAFDPTHDRRTDHRYLTVAIGRDYRDVAPTSGTFSAGGPGILASRKRLSIFDPTA
jgi:transglutaminase-like putative cysteine protease